MKKIITLILCSFLIFSSGINVYATCTNESLNEWATKIEVKFTELKANITYEKNGETIETAFAYLLSVTPQRDDIIIEATNGDGTKLTAVKYTLSDGTEIYGVGCYTNLTDETYVINVYGNGENCAKELLRTIKYTVPQYNEFIKDRRCENSDSELCETFTDATKGMTEEDFEAKMGSLDKKNTSFTKIFEVLKEYGLYVLIPLAIVSVVYIVRIKKYRHEERNK